MHKYKAKRAHALQTKQNAHTRCKLNAHPFFKHGVKRKKKQMDAFHFETLLQVLPLLNDEESFRNFPSTPLLFLCKELSKLTSMLSPPLYFAARDIKSKIKIVEDNLVLVQQATGRAPHPTQGYPLRLIIQNEMGTDATNNSSLPSVTRTLMRLVWFLDFTCVLCSKISRDVEKTLQTCVGEAYELCLSPYHKPLVRVSVQLALYACPSRETFCQNLGVDAATNNHTSLQMLMMLSRNLRQPVDTMWKFFRENNIVQLQ